MHGSVRRGVADIVFDSLLGPRKRDVGSEISSVKSTFSSWDNCMAKTYCKWPVIIGIIVGGLIVFSVLWCIIRCACCGMSCCCTCFSFLKCCDCCGGCCDGKKNKPHKHLDDPYSLPPPQQGYQAPAPMMGGGLATGPPQYAQFEVGRSGLAVDPKASGLSEDALPPMPSWETAAKKHVITDDEKNAVELGELDPATGQKVPLMAGAAGTGISQPPSPAHDMGVSPYGAHPGQIPSHEMGASPYGPQPGQGRGGYGYMGVAGDQYGQQNQNAYNQNGRGYRGPAGPGMAGPGYGPNSPQEMGNNARRGYGPPSPQDPYGNDTGYIGNAGGREGYNRPPPQRQYTNDSNRPFPPQPIRQYSGDSSRPMNSGRQYSERGYQDNFQPNPPRGPSRGPAPGHMASPPLNNGSGFDFGTGAPQQQGYAQRPSPPPPQQMPYGSSYAGSTAPPTYASRSPPPQEQEQAYPGYQSYETPTNQGRGRPGRGTREPPQNWDPVQR